MNGGSATLSSERLNKKTAMSTKEFLEWTRTINILHDALRDAICRKMINM